jgi:iron complex outermembrane receptor protein
VTATLTSLLRGAGCLVRLSVIATCLSLCLIGFSAADDAHASIRKEINIPAGGLGPALRSLAKEHHFQIVYVTEEIGNARTQGAVGDLTAEEALNKLLTGTGLTYRYLDDKTVTIFPVGSSALPTDSGGASPQLQANGSGGGNQTAKEREKSSSGSFRVAQADQTSAGPPMLEEVVVTAQKRQETVNNTPLAVTALGMTQLQDAGVNTVSELTASVPNLQIHTIAVDDFLGITIRGVSNLSYLPQGNPAVSTYIDGIYVDPPVGFSNDLYDLERVEVLRGPQGTLYGRNATGGNVNIITAAPKASSAANFDVSYGNYNDVMAHAMVNVPASDSLAVRAAFMEHRNDGYFSTQGTTYRNYGTADDTGLRLTGLWTPAESFQWRLSLDGYQSHGTPGASIETGANGMPLNGLSPYHQPAYPDPEPDNYIQNGAARSRLDLRLTDNLSLAYITGYQHVVWKYVYGTLGQPGAPATPPATRAAEQNEASTQGHEVDLGLDTEKLKNVLGATYFGESVGWKVQNLVPGLDYASTALTDHGVAKASWGAFDQATWSPITDLRLTGGVRYSHDHQRQPTYEQLTCATVPTLGQVQLLTPISPLCAAPDVITTPSASGTWSKVSWKAGVDYDLTDAALAYASVTTGYKQGGVQPGLPTAFPSTYKPESMTSYEAGTKLRLLDRTLNVRLAGFFEDYTNIQEAQLDFLGGLPEDITANAGGSHVYGVEIESEWRATTADYLSAFFTWLHARYTVFDDAVDPRTNTLIPSLAGSQLPNAPDVSVRLEYHHDFSLPYGATLTPLVASYWQSTSFSEPINVDVYKIGSYSKTDLQLTYATAAGRWRIAAYVQNVENRAVRNADFTLLGHVYSDFNPPRMFGVRVSYSK